MFSQDPTDARADARRRRLHCKPSLLNHIEAAHQPPVSLENLHIRRIGRDWVMSLKPNGTPVCRGTYEACDQQSRQLQAWVAGGGK